MLSTATKTAAKVTKGLAENDARSSVHALEERGREVIEDVSDYADDTTTKVRAFIGRKVEDVNHAGKTVENEIKAYPVRSSLVALGAGFILGALLTRR